MAKPPIAITKIWDELVADPTPAILLVLFPFHQNTTPQWLASVNLHLNSQKAANRCPNLVANHHPIC
jgi:hypothetical protein